MPLDAQVLSHLLVVNDLRHAAEEALARDRNLPSLLLFYSFIDICATLADEVGERSNSKRFKRFVETYGLRIAGVSSHELWAARSSILHAFSPIGDHTRRKAQENVKKTVRPVFYYSWPEKEEVMAQALREMGYADFVLLEVKDIKWLASSVHNALWRRLEEDEAFCSKFLDNAQHLLKDSYQLRLQSTLVAMENMVKISSQG